MSLVEVAMRRASNGGLDKIVATFAALAAGAAVFLMPGGILEQAVRASGLPDMLPQLMPPLGLKSRLGLALLSAGSAFGSTLLMLRFLGFFTKTRAAAPVAEENAPRIRRRDSHPDAPARAPFTISRDMSEPTGRTSEAEPEPFPVEVPQQRVSRPATRRRAPLIEVLSDVREDAADGPAPEEPRRIKSGRDTEDTRMEPFAWEGSAEAAEPEPAEPIAEAIVDTPAPEPEPAIAQVQPEPEPEPELSEQVHAQPQRAWLAAQSESVEEPAQESLTELLARFERAIERKAERRIAAPAGHSDGDEGVGEDGMDLRLRSALENLRRFAPSRG
jgi:hypothetical protein